MNLGGLGRWAMLAGSLTLGLVAGWFGYRIFLAKVPDAMQTAVLNAEARVYYLGGGAAFGVLVYAWTRLIASIAGRAATKAATAAAAGKPGEPPRS